MTKDHVLPYSTGGILTGVILGLSRAIGETAPHHHDRRADLHRLPAAVAGDRRVPVPQLRVADERVHRHADPDVQLGVAAGPGVPAERRRGRRDPARA
ncbi:MAG: hypothetical protein MZV65_53515 [Chromatiales bacterium]|nr:hypothetical protein [Chromatiales bacterium]